MSPDFILTLNDLDVMARTVVGEARGEAREGQEAVAWAIRNRVETAERHLRRHKRVHHYGTPEPAVICRKHQAFSCWNRGDPNLKFIEALRCNDKLYLRTLAIVVGVFAGEIADPTGGATLYEAVPGVPPAWDRTKIKPTVTIGRHAFYQEL